MTYATEVAADSPRHWFKLDEATSATSIANSGSDTYTTVLTKGANFALNQSGVSGTAVYLNETATAYAGGNLALSGGFPRYSTWEFWVKTTVGGIVFDWGNTAGFRLSIQSAGKIRFIWGTGIAVNSTTSVNNDTWRHCVVVMNVDTMTVKMYIDGALDVSHSVASMANITSNQNMYIGYNTANTFNGYIDEVASYTTNLSAARILAHYQAGTPAVAGGYTAQAMTATGLAVDPAVSIHDSYAAQAVTASATMPNGTASIADGYDAQAMTATGLVVDPVVDLKTTRPTRDVTVSESNVVTESAVTLSAGTTSDNYIFMDFDDTHFASANSTTSATLTLYVEGRTSGTHTFYIAPITGTWNANSTLYSQAVGSEISFTTTATGTKTVDVTSLVTPNNFHGFRIRQSTSNNANYDEFASSEATTVSQRPSLRVEATVVYLNGGYTAQAMTASGLFVDPSVQTENFPDQDVEVTAEPMAAQAAAPGGSYSQELSFAADPATGVADIVEPVVGGELNALFETDPTTASARLIQPALVNGVPIQETEADDDYFMRVNLFSPYIWYRLNEKTGTAVTNRAKDNNHGVYSGVTIGNYDGPSGRSSVHFDGVDDFIVQTEASDGELADSDKTLEFTFRTTKGDQFLMGGTDNTGNRSTGIVVNTSGQVDFYLSGGKFQFRHNNVTKFSGFKNLSDNEWHHVAVASYAGGVGGEGGYIEVYVDGQLEVRRYLGVSANQLSAAMLSFGFPDNIGGRTGIASDAWYLGDMTEVVIHDTLITPSDIQRNYYAVMGFRPVYANPLEADATSGNHKGKGSQKRGLYLYWNSVAEYNQGYVDSAETGDGYDFDPFPEMVRGYGLEGRIATETNNVIAGGYAWNAYRVGGPSGTPYRDPVTDDLRLIDLETDVDLADFDIIVFKDWPDEGYEDDLQAARLGSIQQFVAAKEKLLGQLRDAVDAGISLMITQPRLAVDMGIVNRVEFCPDLKEQKFNFYQGQGARGGYDYGAAVRFPFDVTRGGGSTPPFVLGDPGYLEYKALFYADTHKNNSYRVRALVEGLTDIPSVMLAESVWHQDADLFGDNMPAARYIERENGLLLGDEFVFWGVDRYGNTRSDTYNNGMSFWGLHNRFAGRLFGAFASPVENVLAGTVVTTFAEKLWSTTQEVDNPYKDYATTIVLRPGDNLNGTPVGGKIFVNFTEAPTAGPRIVPFQNVPETLPEWYKWEENAEQRAWQYSFTRVSATNTNLGTGQESLTILNPNGTYTQTGTVGTGGLTSVRYNEQFPVTYKVLAEMTYRGLVWLADRPEVSDGDESVVAQRMSATAALPQPTVVAQRSTEALAAPMRAVAALAAPDEAFSPDVETSVLPATAEARMAQPGRAFAAAPMEATAEIVEPEEITAVGDFVYLYMPSYEVILYMKEEV